MKSFWLHIVTCLMSENVSLPFTMVSLSLDVVVCCVVVHCQGNLGFHLKMRDRVGRHPC